MQVLRYPASRYRTIDGCINILEIKINEKLGNDIVIILDSPGIKIANRG
jgi:hypothetical protein